MSGSPPAFEVFLEANRATVYRFLLVAVGPADADDVFQETFLAALRAWPRVRDDGRLDRWALTIASRKAIDHHRRRVRNPVPTPDRPDEAADPVAERDDELWAAVRSLPPKQRAALVHRHVLDRPYPEIAVILGCTEEAARASVSEATRKLRRMMT
jgi:RNA polymerase sigma factor (sigma-70 family)